MLEVTHYIITERRAFSYYDLRTSGRRPFDVATSKLLQKHCNTIPVHFAFEWYTYLKNHFSFKIFVCLKIVIKSLTYTLRANTNCHQYSIDQSIKQCKITIAGLRAIWASYVHTSSYVNCHFLFATKCRHVLSDGHTKFCSINLHWTVCNTSIIWTITWHVLTADINLFQQYQYANKITELVPVTA